MADPAAQPESAPPAVRRRARRPSRLAGALLAAVSGIAVLGVGFVRTAGGLTGPPDNPAGGTHVAGRSAVPEGSPDGFPGSPLPLGASASAEPGASAAPGASAGADSSFPPGGSAGPPTTDPLVLAGQLQAALDRIRAKLAIPGVSATILLPDGSSWSGVSGLADVGARTPVTAGTAFAYASVSKTFTSALILQLIGEGKIHLGDSASRLLPPLRLTLDRRITVAMLLNHTSGLADYFLNPKIDGPLQAHPGVAWTTDRALSYVGKRRSAPGAAWHYSNTNYLLLGLIAEHATGQSLAAAIRTRLLEPAGLTVTWYQDAEDARVTIAHGYRFVGTNRTAKPIDLADGSGIAPFRSVITASAGAGSMAGTSADLAHWARLLYSGTVLGPQGTAMLLSGFTKTTNYLPGVVYGYGVQAVSIDGHPSLGHSGRLLGFRSAVRHFPLDGLTIAVLTNQSRADPALIVRALLRVADPPEPVSPPARPALPGPIVCWACSLSR